MPDEPMTLSDLDVVAEACEYLNRGASCCLRGDGTTTCGHKSWNLAFGQEIRGATIASQSARIAALTEALAAAEVKVYADVVAQGLRIYANEANDMQDRRAIMAFIDRFKKRAALSQPAPGSGEEEPNG